MPAIAVIGGQWGDEGKGKVVDLLAGKADIVVRFSGGDNAGHTVINQFGEFKLHLVPSGIFSPRAISIIGNGTVVNPKILAQELDMLHQKNIDTSRFFVSDRAHVIMPYHPLIDSLEEKLRGGKALGTTGRGIGPAFMDKISRQGIRVGDLLDKNFKEQLKIVLEYKNLILTRVYESSPLSLSEIYDEYMEYGKKLKPYIKDTTLMIEDALENGLSVLLEGAQGTMLDPDFGTYPYGTSSSPIAGGACIGAGIGPTRISKVLGIFKAYCTRVGSGPMPTELTDATGDMIRERAHEFGTTTGRPRRVGWFDAVAARFSNRVNAFTGMAVTRFDILDILPTIKICTAYKIGSKIVNEFPASIGTLEQCKPVYEEMPGWQTSTDNIRKFADLPAEAKAYLTRLEVLTGCVANLICVGPERNQTIVKAKVI